MSLLNQYGWNQWFQSHYTHYKQQNLLPGRVAAVHGHRYVLVCEDGELEAEISGSLTNSKELWELPKVGDWVVLMVYDALGYIIDVLPRQNELARKMPGAGMEKQVIASNIDFALILQGLDRDFNLMRLQRYLNQVYNSKIGPIVILNKCDLAENPEWYVRQVNNMGYDCPVVLVSAVNNQGIAELNSKYLKSGKTYAMLGSSGVGKSTLVNSLLGSEIHATGSLSQANKKGKHTTTSRHLVMLPNGSMIIDSPGMREFGLTSETEEPGSFHPMIDELAVHCKFPDCTHRHEPSCAVAEAVKTGLLPSIVYQSYLKLLKEKHRYSISVEEKRRAERQFGKIGREANELRRKRKF